MALLRWLLSKHGSTCDTASGHGEHLQSPGLGMTRGDTVKGCRHPGVGDFAVTPVILSGIVLQYEHNLTQIVFGVC